MISLFVLNEASELFHVTKTCVPCSVLLWLYLLIVILWSQEVINDGHPLSELLAQCIQKAICVFWAWRFGEGVTPLAAAVGGGTRWVVRGLWRRRRGTVQTDVGVGLPTRLACQPWWIELGWRGAGERLRPGCRGWGAFTATWHKEETYSIQLYNDS